MSEQAPESEPRRYRYTRGHLWALLLSYEIWLRSHGLAEQETRDRTGYAAWLMKITREFIDSIATLAEEEEQ